MAVLWSLLALTAPVFAALPEVDFSPLLDGPRPASAAPTAAPTASPAAAVVADATGTPVPVAEFVDRLAAADLVYVGEQHDQASHHAVQAELLHEVHARRSEAFVGFEMLSLDYQDELDAYLSGAMDEAAFAAVWNEAWGFPFEIYQPILAYARENGMRGVALNAPIALVRKVAGGGLGSLTPEERGRLPKEIRPIRDPRYLEYVLASLRQHGRMPPEREARMLEAMAVWNETMAESLLKGLREGGPGVVVAGMGHMLYGAGIGESVAARAGLRQTVVLPYPLDGTSAPAEELLRRIAGGDGAYADFFRLLP